MRPRYKRWVPALLIAALLSAAGALKSRILAEGSAERPASAEEIREGRMVYVKNCVLCHQAKGEGLTGLIPPLASSDYLMEDKARSIRIVLAGQTGEIVVNGQTYNGIMPPIPLPDAKAASVLTYVRASWGNSGGTISASEVKAVRAQMAVE